MTQNYIKEPKAIEKEPNNTKRGKMTREET